MIRITKKAIIPIQYLLFAAIIIIALVAVSPFIFKFISPYLTVFTKENVNGYQYVGSILSEDWPNEDYIASSGTGDVGTSSIYGYSVKTTKSDYQCENVLKWDCRAPLSGSAAYGTDKYGCTLYTYTTRNCMGLVYIDPQTTIRLTNVGAYNYTDTNYRQQYSSGYNICTVSPTNGVSIIKCVDGNQTIYNSRAYSSTVSICRDRLVLSGGAYNIRNESVCSWGCWVKHNITKDGRVIFASKDWKKTYTSVFSGVFNC